MNRGSRRDSLGSVDPDEQRYTSRETWEQAAAGWGRMADQVRDWGLDLSAKMVDALALQPGQRVLELAAGPGDTGFMAAELVAPGGTLICSDGAEAMLAVARERAEAQGIRNVEFRQLELEWIDLPTADVDAVLCRWGIMLVVDSEAAAQEIRRVLKPGGRAAIAVWDEPARNPWTTISSQALIELGFAAPPDPGEPGMFKLAGDGVLQELLLTAGLVDVRVTPVAMERRFDTVDQYLAETLAMSSRFRSTYRELELEQQLALKRRIARDVRPFTAADGSLAMPGSSLVAVASA
jgi:ubiquinone/menaquinone biosynthesis C-methylase UbiE